jgi:LacI family transcriptional regulator, repressor for deo operon, udp, cdd, tsx, nupC, and nupG
VAGLSGAAPASVFAHSDEVAFGALLSLRRAGLRVPEDVSVIGIDDHPFAELTDLTTVRQPVLEQATLGGRQLLNLLDGAPVKQGTTFPTEVVTRGSTAAPRARRRPRRSAP